MWQAFWTVSINKLFVRVEIFFRCYNKAINTTKKQVNGLEDSVKEQNSFSDIPSDKTDKSAKHKINDSVFTKLFKEKSERTKLFQIDRRQSCFAGFTLISIGFGRGINDETTSDIIDNIQVLVFIYNTNKILFGIPAVTENNHIFLGQNPGMTKEF